MSPGEFRVFVHSGQVRGISQYDTLCYFPHLVQQKAAIAALILQFHEALHQRVGHLFDDYVLDLALLDNPAEAAPTPHQGTFVPGMCPPRSPVARSLFSLAGGDQPVGYAHRRGALQLGAGQADLGGFRYTHAPPHTTAHITTHTRTHKHC
jgi:hypothetical protein